MKKYSKNLNFVESNVGDNTLLFNTVKEEFYVLNVTSYMILQLYNSESSLKVVIDTIEDYYKKSTRSDIKKEVVAFVKDLISMNILKENIGNTISKVENVSFQKNAEETFVSPKLDVLTKKWMVDNHPAAYYKGSAFSDMWDS